MQHTPHRTPTHRLLRWISLAGKHAKSETRPQKISPVTIGALSSHSLLFAPHEAHQRAVCYVCAVLISPSPLAHPKPPREQIWLSKRIPKEELNLDKHFSVMSYNMLAQVCPSALRTQPPAAPDERSAQFLIRVRPTRSKSTFRTRNTCTFLHATGLRAC